MSALPLTAADLRTIAEALDPIETNEYLTENPSIGRIEVHLPGSDEVVGHFVREGEPNGSGEAWLGFKGRS